MYSRRKDYSWGPHPIVTSDPKIVPKSVRLQVICNEMRATDGDELRDKVKFVLLDNRQYGSTLYKYL